MNTASTDHNKQSIHVQYQVASHTTYSRVERSKLDGHEEQEEEGVIRNVGW